MISRPRSVSVTLIFILLNVLIWLTFGIVVTTNAHPALPNSLLIKWIVAFMAFAIAGVLLVLHVFLSRHNRVAYFLTLGLFAVITLVILFDDFGLIDLFVLTINIAPIILLVKDRAWYLQKGPNIIENQKAA